MCAHPGTARPPGVLASWPCASSATFPCTDICPDRVEAAGEATGRACMSPSVWPRGLWPRAGTMGFSRVRMRMAWVQGSCPRSALARWASPCAAWAGVMAGLLARSAPPFWGVASRRGLWPCLFGLRHGRHVARSASPFRLGVTLSALGRGLSAVVEVRRCECFPARLRPKAAVDDRPSPPVGFLCVIAGMWPARLRLLGSASRLVEDASSRVLLARLHPKAAVGDRPSPPRWVLVLGRHVCSPG